MSKSKRIKDAAKELERALKKHVDVVTDSAVSMKKAQRAAARLASAAQVYAEAVGAKTGLDNPFLTGGGRLDEEATRSLLAERDGIAKSLTGSIPALPDLPTEVDLSPAEPEADEPIASGAEDASAGEIPLDDAVEDWEDDSIEVDDDEPAAVDADADDADDASGDEAAASGLTANIVAIATAPDASDEGAAGGAPTEAEPAGEPQPDQPAAYGGWPAPQTSGDVPAAAPEAAAPEPAPWTAEAEAAEPSGPRHAQPESEDATDGYEHIESVWSAAPSESAAASETSASGDEAPALPEQEPSSEEEKPYSEDI